jgi:MoxR-like ATPase
MGQLSAQIREKSVQLSASYQAPLSEMVGREHEMRKILAAWMRVSTSLPLSPLLVGEPGLGKNRIVYECARVCGKELYICQGHEDVTAEDLICSVRFSDNPGKKMDYIVSPLVTAMLRGGVCFIDEIGKIRPRALAPLASLLDERCYIDSVLLGERIIAHPGFRFVAATNTDDLDENPLPDFIRSRMRPVISVGYPGREEIDRIVRARFDVMKNDGVALLDRFWSLWRHSEGDRLPTPRDSIYIFGYALNLADLEAIQTRQPYDLDNGPGCYRMEEAHLEKAFDAFRQSLRGENRAHSAGRGSVAQQ